MAADAHAARIAENENLVREGNDEVGRGLGEHLDDRSGLFGFRCECAWADCEQRVRVTLELYERIRQDPMRFIVFPGHVVPEAERTVERAEHYWILEKYENVRDIVEAGDPRRG